METRTYNVYQFDELTKDQQQKAIDNLRYINVEHEWHTLIIDEYTAKLIDLGYYDIKILFSGFYSQGDGACFTASVDLEEYLTAHKLKAKYRYLLKNASNSSINITHSSRYYYSTSTSVENRINYNFESPFDETGKALIQLDELTEYIRKEREQLGAEIYSMLQKKYEYLTSDEAIIETIKANDYDLTPDGKID